MANNKAGTSGAGEILAQRRRELDARREKLGSYAALAKELGVNFRYVFEFIRDGIVPKNKQVRKLMGIVVVSRGAERYRALSEIARMAGWQSWVCR